LRRRTEGLEQENQQLTEANEVMKRNIGEVFDCFPKVKKDLTNLERELARLKEEMRTMKT
jgi:ABC-type enterochelin transport system substrate-binding protein